MSRSEVIHYLETLRDGADHSSKHYACPDRAKQESDRAGFARWADFYGSALREVFASETVKTVALVALVLIVTIGCASAPVAPTETYAVGLGAYDAVGVLYPGAGRMIVSDRPRPFRAGGDAFGVYQGATKAVRK